jgi:hypothetical protein
MTSSMTPPSPFWARTPAPPLVSAEEAPPKTETTSSEDLLRKMIVEKISGAEVVVASMESSIAEKERLIAENRDTLAGSREEILNLRKQLAILDSMSGVVPPTKVCDEASDSGGQWNEERRARRQANKARQIAKKDLRNTAKPTFRQHFSASGKRIWSGEEMAALEDERRRQQGVNHK